MGFYIPDYTQNLRWLQAVARQGYIVATITMEGDWDGSGEYRMYTSVSNEKPGANRLGSRQLVVAEQLLADLMVRVLAALQSAGWKEHIGLYRHFTEWEAPWSVNTADRIHERVSSHCSACGAFLWSEGKNWGKGYWLTSCPHCQAAETTEQAIEVYARPAEPEPTPVYVAEPAEQPVEQPPCFCPDCGSSLFDHDRQIWLIICPNCHWSTPDPVPAWLSDVSLPEWLENAVADADALLAEAEQIRARGHVLRK